MKKIYLFLIVVTAICCTSCNNEWEDEQFVQLASFKAIPNSSGVTSTYVRYNPGGVVKYSLPVLISGSTVNSQNRTVHITLDEDTLKSLNYERYGGRDKLYYQKLDNQYYTMPETVDVPAGESMGTFPIDFTLGGTNNSNPLDLTDKYILPLTIVDDASYDYQSNPRKHFRKALLNITPYNDYSGTYDGSLLKIYLENQGDAFTVANHKAYVVDDKTVFVYMGLRDEDYLDRKDYKLFIRFTDEMIIPGKYKLELWTDKKGDPSQGILGNNFELLTEKANDGTIRDIQPYYVLDTQDDPAKPYLKHIYITLYMAYSFEDYTLSPGQVLKYKVDGTLSMERKLNTLIPDEDQQIQWD
ncbi:MAG: DUF4973 domain-containing protein [Bacteroides xylanisolvens]